MTSNIDDTDRDGVGGAGGGGNVASSQIVQDGIYVGSECPVVGLFIISTITVSGRRWLLKFEMVIRTLVAEAAEYVWKCVVVD